MNYITLAQLSKKLGGRSRSSLYRDFDPKDGFLPAPIKIGARLYWIESEIDAAIATQK